MTKYFMAVFAALSLSQTASANSVNWSCFYDTSALFRGDSASTEQVNSQDCATEAIAALEKAGCIVDQRTLKRDVKPNILTEVRISVNSTNCQNHRLATVSNATEVQQGKIVFQYTCSNGTSLKQLELAKDSKPSFGMFGEKVICRQQFE